MESTKYYNRQRISDSEAGRTELQKDFNPNFIVIPIFHSKSWPILSQQQSGIQYSSIGFDTWGIINFYREIKAL